MRGKSGSQAKVSKESHSRFFSTVNGNGVPSVVMSSKSKEEKKGSDGYGEEKSYALMKSQN